MLGPEDLRKVACCAQGSTPPRWAGPVPRAETRPSRRGSDQVQVGLAGEPVGGAVAPGGQWSRHGSALREARGSVAQCNNFVV